MVRKGEYLERAIVIPSDTPLEGLYHRGARSPGLLIAPPHPLAGGSMESTLIAELAWAVTRAGHPTLRFNYRGVGASPGRFDERSAYEDLRRAAHHLRVCLAEGDESALPPIAALGIGLGGDLVAQLALEAGFPVSPLVLISIEAAPVSASLPGYGGILVELSAEQHFLRDLGKIVAESLTGGGSLKPDAAGAR